MMHWGNFGSMGFGGFSMSWIFIIIFWAFIIWGTVYLVRQLLGGMTAVSGKESAEDVLKKRYAAGEIGKDQYHDTLAAIRGKT